MGHARHGLGVDEGGPRPTSRTGRIPGHRERHRRARARRAAALASAHPVDGRVDRASIAASRPSSRSLQRLRPAASASLRSSANSALGKSVRPWTSTTSSRQPRRIPRWARWISAASPSRSSTPPATSRAGCGRAWTSGSAGSVTLSVSGPRFDGSPGAAPGVVGRMTMLLNFSAERITVNGAPKADARPSTSRATHPLNPWSVDRRTADQPAIARTVVRAAPRISSDSSPGPIPRATRTAPTSVLSAAAARSRSPSSASRCVR